VDKFVRHDALPPFSVTVPIAAGAQLSGFHLVLRLAPEHDPAMQFDARVQRDTDGIGSKVLIAALIVFLPVPTEPDDDQRRDRELRLHLQADEIGKRTSSPRGGIARPRRR
jgi:hypothetical protein